MNTKSINFNMISLFQFVFSILVIALHCTRLFDHDVAHFIQKSFFSRMAVPYFLISSSYFLVLKSESETDYFKKYTVKMSKIYLLWSCIYLPYALFYFKQLNVATTWLPAAFLVGLFYSGMCYHLWYIPAFFCGFLLVKILINKVGYRITFIFCSLFYLIGATETYSAILEGTSVGEMYVTYREYFYTTRNGLFFTPAFIFCGIMLSRYQKCTFFKKNRVKKLIIATILLCLEVTFVFYNQGDDKNFLITLIPFSVFLFNWTAQSHWFKERDFKGLKSKSVLYYFLHPLFIEAFPFVFYFVDLNVNYYGWVKFVVAITCCQITYFLVDKIRKRKVNRFIYVKLSKYQ